MPFTLPTGRAALMGILNVTPDSFSDGGVHFDSDVAVEAGLRMVAEGADLIDIGGESTRPNAEPVAIHEELRRVLPVIEQLSSAGVAVSIDTMKPEVAKEALRAGAVVVNDVTALGSPGMAEIVAGAGCIVCLMHMKGTPQTMQVDPQYDDVVAEVRSYLISRAEFAESAGVRQDRIWIDPGIGFGKTVGHNLSLLKGLNQLTETSYPVLIGVSRKSFLGKLSGAEVLPVGERIEASLAAQSLAQAAGAKIIRVHDVLGARRALDLVAAVQRAE